MNKPHKHAEVIKAWADGAEIECRCPINNTGWLLTNVPVWKDGRFLFSMQESQHDTIPPSRTVTLYRALVRNMEGRYFSPYELFSGLDDDGIEDWNSGGCEFIRLLTEYPIEVEL